MLKYGLFVQILSNDLFWINFSRPSQFFIAINANVASLRLPAVVQTAFLTSSTRFVLYFWQYCILYGFCNTFSILYLTIFNNTGKSVFNTYEFSPTLVKTISLSSNACSISSAIFSDQTSNVNVSNPFGANKGNNSFLLFVATFYILEVLGNKRIYAEIL